MKSIFALVALFTLSAFAQSTTLSTTAGTVTETGTGSPSGTQTSVSAPSGLPTDIPPQGATAAGCGITDAFLNTGQEQQAALVLQTQQCGGSSTGSGSTSIFGTDRIISTRRCFLGNTGCDKARGTWYMSGGEQHSIDTMDGCGNRGLAHLETLCLDYTRRRGHFIFQGQGPGKRCLKVTHTDQPFPCGVQSQCITYTFDERPCTW